MFTFSCQYARMLNCCLLLEWDNISPMIENVGQLVKASMDMHACIGVDLTLCFRLYIMPEGKHNIHLRYTKEFNSVVEKFLDKDHTTKVP